MDNRLRLYETKSDYLNDANSLTYPTVSFIEENQSFKKKERSYLFATYKVTDTSAAITLLGSRFDISQISAMYIDGERISSPVATYTFSTLGQHTVKMLIKDTVTSYNHMFNGCYDLTVANCDGLIIDNITSMQYMFANCSKLQTVVMTQDISNMLIADITSIASMFENANSNITVSHGGACDEMWELVKRQSYALETASFTPSLVINDDECDHITVRTCVLSGISNVTCINEKIRIVKMTIDDEEVIPNTNYVLTKGKTHNVKMSFPKSLGISSLAGLFSGCTSIRHLDLSEYKSSKITNINYMCSGCSQLSTVDLSGLDMTNCNRLSINGESPFKGCDELYHLVYFQKTPSSALTLEDLGASFVRSIDFEKWDASNVTSMRYLCRVSTMMPKVTMVAFPKDFNTSKLVDISYMFAECDTLTAIDLSSLDLTKVTAMTSVFESCKKLTSIKLNKVKSTLSNYANMFSGITTTGKLYYNGSYEPTTIINNKPSNWTAVNLNCAPEFTGTYKGNSGGTATPIFGADFDLSQVKEVYIDGTKQPTVASAYTFSSSGSNTVRCVLYADKFTDASFMFKNCTTITDMDVSKLDTSKVIDMNSMFYNCNGLTTAYTLDISSFDTHNVTDMNNMFFSMGAEIIFPQNFGSQVTDMGYMFSGNSSKSPSRNINLSTFNTKNVQNFAKFIYDAKTLSSVTITYLNTSVATNMSYMFAAEGVVTTNRPIASLSVSTFDTSNVTDMSGMFYNCNNFTYLDLSNFDTNNVTDMSYMFYTCSKLTSLDLNSFDTSNVTDMTAMFSGCTSLTSITFGSQADVSKVTNYTSMFSDITTTGTLYYPLAYANSWNNIIVTNQSTSNFPSTWTSTVIDY